MSRALQSIGNRQSARTAADIPGAHKGEARGPAIPTHHRHHELAPSLLEGSRSGFRSTNQFRRRCNRQLDPIDAMLYLH